jgi:ATP-dependent Clp protease protease subunit
LNEIYAKHSGLDVKKVEDMIERDKFLAPEEAKELGLIDEVVTSRPVVEDELKRVG